MTIKEFCLLNVSTELPAPSFAASWARADDRLKSRNAYGTGGYVRNLVSSPAAGFAIGAYAGVSELWRTDTPVDLQARKLPVIGGIDDTLSVSFLAEEYVVRSGRSAAKFMSLLRRKPGMSFEAFSAAWRGRHADVVRSVEEIWGLFRGYRQNHIIPGTCRHLDGSEMVRPFDGIVEIWFDSLADLESTMMSSRYREIIRPDEETFVDLPNTRLYSTETIVIAPPDTIR